ncbi:MAG: hypothetical protein ACTSQG_04635 [Promethearchaeota archaeon]
MPKKKKIINKKITNESILGVLSKTEWLSTGTIMHRLKIIDNMRDARSLRLKLKELVRNEIILEDYKRGRKYYKLK